MQSPSVFQQILEGLQSAKYSIVFISESIFTIPQTINKVAPVQEYFPKPKRIDLFKWDNKSERSL